VTGIQNVCISIVVYLARMHTCPHFLVFQSPLNLRHILLILFSFLCSCLFVILFMLFLFIVLPLC